MLNICRLMPRINVCSFAHWCQCKLAHARSVFRPQLQRRVPWIGWCSFILHVFFRTDRINCSWKSLFWDSSACFTSICLPVLSNCLVSCLQERGGIDCWKIALLWNLDSKDWNITHIKLDRLGLCFVGVSAYWWSCNDICSLVSGSTDACRLKYAKNLVTFFIVIGLFQELRSTDYVELKVWPIAGKRALFEHAAIPFRFIRIHTYLPCCWRHLVSLRELSLTSKGHKCILLQVRVSQCM